MVASRASRSFRGRTSVSRAYASGTPADVDVPRVAKPLPALDQQGIYVTVIAPFELQILVFPVTPRANRIALMAASVPGDEPNALGVGVVVEDHAPQLIFESGGGPKRRSIRDGLENAVLNHRVGVPEDEGPTSNRNRCTAGHRRPRCGPLRPGR